MITKETVQEISKLKSESGGTSLVTIYMPSNYSLNIVNKTLTSELSTASNIKDKTVKKDVITALKSAMETIKSTKMHTAPENGLVLCSGLVTQCL